MKEGAGEERIAHKDRQTDLATALGAWIGVVFIGADNPSRTTARSK